MPQAMQKNHLIPGGRVAIQIFYVVDPANGSVLPHTDLSIGV